MQTCTNHVKGETLKPKPTVAAHAVHTAISTTGPPTCSCSSLAVPLTPQKLARRSQKSAHTRASLKSFPKCLRLGSYSPEGLLGGELAVLRGLDALVLVSAVDGRGVAGLLFTPGRGVEADEVGFEGEVRFSRFFPSVPWKVRGPT